MLSAEMNPEPLRPGIDTDLSGKTALVCGASQGIGEASAFVLAELGASVVLLARSRERLEAVASMLPKSKAEQRHHVIALDLKDRAQLAARLNEHISHHGPIQILVCNTGGPKGGPVLEAKESEFVETFENHLLASSLMTQICVPGMKATNYGRIINIISTSVKVPIANLGVSNTVRAAVAAWAKTLSMELAPEGITVNNVLPGYTETPRLESLMTAAAAKSQKTYDQIAQEWTQSVPMRRFAQPREVAAAVGFFASPAARFITGTSLAVDGGRTGAL